MEKTWVIVADRARGRIFSVSKPKGPLTEMEGLVHPESRAHERDLISDRPGRGRGSHRSLGTANAAHDHEAEDFARELAARLETGRVHGDVANLILIAAPDFLGLMRKSLNGQLSKMVSLEVTKNLTQLRPDEIRSHLPEYL